MDHLLSRENNSLFHVNEELVASDMISEWLSQDSKRELVPIRLITSIMIKKTVFKGRFFVAYSIYKYLKSALLILPQ